MGWHACIEFQQHDAKAVDICLWRELLVAAKLGCHVSQRSHDNVGFCAVGALLLRAALREALSGQTKVAQLWNEVQVQENIGTEGERRREGECGREEGERERSERERERGSKQSGDGQEQGKEVSL